MAETAEAPDAASDLLRVAAAHQALFRLHRDMGKSAASSSPGSLGAAVKDALGVLTQALLEHGPTVVEGHEGDSDRAALAHYVKYVQAHQAHDIAKQLKGLTAIRKYLKVKIAEDKVAFHNAHLHHGAEYVPSEHVEGMQGDLERVTAELKRLRLQLERVTPTKARVAQVALRSPVRVGHFDAEFPSFSSPRLPEAAEGTTTKSKKKRKKSKGRRRRKETHETPTTPQPQAQQRAPSATGVLSLHDVDGDKKENTSPSSSSSSAPGGTRSPPLIVGVRSEGSPAHVSRTLARVFASPQRESVLVAPPAFDPFPSGSALSNHSGLDRSLRLARRDTST